MTQPTEQDRPMTTIDELNRQREERGRVANLRRMCAHQFQLVSHGSASHFVCKNCGAVMKPDALDVSK